MYVCVCVELEVEGVGERAQCVANAHLVNYITKTKTLPTHTTQRWRGTKKRAEKRQFAYLKGRIKRGPPPLQFPTTTKPN